MISSPLRAAGVPGRWRQLEVRRRAVRARRRRKRERRGEEERGSKEERWRDMEGRV
jgi:hypothetical protein